MGSWGRHRIVAEERRRSFKAERNHQIKAEYAAGISVSAIAARSGLSMARVYQIVHDEMPSNKASAERQRRAREARKDQQRMYRLVHAIAFAAISQTDDLVELPMPKVNRHTQVLDIHEAFSDVTVDELAWWFGVGRIGIRQIIRNGRPQTRGDRYRDRVQRHDRLKRERRLAEKAAVSDARRRFVFKVRRLALDSEYMWQSAVDTCVDPEGRPLPHREKRALLDAENAEKAWEEAIDAIGLNAWDAARSALERARLLAADWGEPSPENKALDLLREHVDAMKRWSR